MEVARIWRQRKQRYSMEGVICNHCGAPQFPVRPVCQHCGGIIGAETSMENNELNIPVAIRVASKADLTVVRG